MTRYVRIYNPYDDRMLREERPKKECPNCGEYEFFETQYFKGQRFFLWRWLGLVEKRSEEEMGWTTDKHECDECRYQKGDELE